MESDGWNYHFFSKIKNYAAFQIVLFVVFSLIVRIDIIKMFLIPDYVKHQRATRHAYMQFFSHDVHATAHGGGIMIFVSVAERHVEIIADQKINSKVDPEAWQKIVDQFLNQVKEKKICDGFLGAIEQCGALLTEHYPDDGTAKNELNDHLIEV